MRLILDDTTAAPDVAADDLLTRYRSEPGERLVRMMFIASLDGAVTVDGRSGGLGNAADRQVIGVLRAVADAIMVGAGTLRDEGYGAVRPTAARRAWRTSAGLAEYPRLVIVSGGLDLDPASDLFTGSPVRPIVITHTAADADRRDALAAVADVLVHGVDRVDLVAAAAELRDRYRLDHVLCEGGPHLFGSLHAADLVDEVCLTVAPLVAGAGAGRIVAGPPGALERMRLVHVLESEGYLLLRYARQHPN